MRCSGGHFDPARLQKQLAELEEEANHPDLWQNQQRAAKVLKEKNILSAKLEAFNKVEQGLQEGKELYEMATSEGEDELAQEAERIGFNVEEVAICTCL